MEIFKNLMYLLGMKIKAKRVPFEEIKKPGDFAFSTNYDCIHLWLPRAKHPHAVPIQLGPEGKGLVWGWDGDTDRPSLTPSLNEPGVWHGMLHNGYFI